MTTDLAVRAVELSRLALFTISSSGVVATWNRAAEELYGYPETEAAGRAVDFLCFPGERTALSSAVGEAAGNGIERHRRGDGTEVFVDLRLERLDGGLLVCARNVSSERRAQTGLAASRDALGASREELRRLAGRILDAQETERRRIARELHDEFKQRLGALGFRLAAFAESSAAGSADGEGSPRHKLEALIDQVAELGDDIRRISHELHPAALERLGLAAALEAHATEVEARQGLAVRFTLRDAEEPLTEGVALGLYRIAQEALQNVARHSGARQAHMTLVRDDGPSLVRDDGPSQPRRANATPRSRQRRANATLRLAIADDGVGFDPNEALSRGGLGLASMEERARLLGGRLRVASTPGAGTEIEVVLPLVPGEAGDDSPEAVEGDAEVGSRPRLIGPYRLLGLLGEGAMATVYLAQEPPPLERQVAIKLYRVPLAGPRQALSFKAERQALAKLRHPNVGLIHEARTTEEGDPYIVMEHVPGMPITDYCDRYRLDLRQRVELFVTVCEAVRHIHQKGVLHRDLKPPNVLVMERDGQAIPKIVDFGIAKGLDQPLAEGTVWSPEAAGTPTYVSPEVRAGNEADTRSDVYALGVMLFELLTGVLPAETEAEARHSDGFPLPSRRLAALGASTSGRRRPSGRLGASAAQRRTGTGALIRALRGDLDWITRKALAPEPENRYTGAAALAEDLERHLRDEPVVAGPPDFRYRLTRRIRRHRVEVIAAALVLCALVVGLVTTTWQARRAARETEVAEQVAEFLEDLFRLSGPGEAQGNALTAREILDRGAERLDRELADDPIKARLQLTVGDIYRELGLFDQARSITEDSLALRRELFGEDHVETAKSLRMLAHVISEGGRPAEAEPLLEQALAIEEQTLGENHLEVAETLTILAHALYRQGEQRRAVPLFRRAHEIVSTSLPSKHPQAIEALRNLGVAIQALGDPERTRIHYQHALELGETHLGPDHPEVLMLLNNLATTYSLESNYSRARATYERLLPRLAKVYGPNHWRTLRSRLSLARVTLLQGQNARALELATETFERIELTLGTDHWLTAKGSLRLGRFAFFQGRYDQAETAYRRALAVASAIDPDVANVARPLNALASLAFARSDLNRAEALAASVLERIPTDSPLHQSVALDSRYVLARVALARGELERAEALIRDILSVVDPEIPGEPTSRKYVIQRALAHLCLGEVLAALGDAAGARRSWQLAAELMAPLAPNPYARAYHAVALLRLGRVDEARPIAHEALRGYRYPDLIELCERHGIEVPPLDE